MLRLTTRTVALVWLVVGWEWAVVKLARVLQWVAAANFQGQATNWASPFFLQQRVLASTLQLVLVKKDGCQKENV